MAIHGGIFLMLLYCLILALFIIVPTLIIVFTIRKLKNSDKKERF